MPGPFDFDADQSPSAPKHPAANQPASMSGAKLFAIIVTAGLVVVGLSCAGFIAFDVFVTAAAKAQKKLNDDAAAAERHRQNLALIEATANEEVSEAAKLYRAGDKIEAKERLRKVVKEFPETRAAAEARRLLAKW